MRRRIESGSLSLSDFSRRGGLARAKKLGKDARSRGARRAALARWGFTLNQAAGVTKRTPDDFGAALREFARAVVARKDPALIRRQPIATGIPEYDAYLAGMAEAVALEMGWDVPAWVDDPSLILRTPYFGNAPAGMKIPLVAESPVSFRKRNIFIDAEAVAGMLDKARNEIHHEG